MVRADTAFGLFGSRGLRNCRGWDGDSCLCRNGAHHNGCHMCSLGHRTRPWKVQIAKPASILYLAKKGQREGGGRRVQRRG